jgi:hypothetical protein
MHHVTVPYKKTKIHLIAADARTAICFALKPGNDHHAPAGRTLLEELGAVQEAFILPRPWLTLKENVL